MKIRKHNRHYYFHFQKKKNKLNNDKYKIQF